jgi:hypothetical protein
MQLKVDINIDGSQRHYASRKKLDFKLGYFSNKAHANAMP